jgi:hypothetical protein
MSRWSEAFRASVRRRDTADTTDTAQRDTSPAQSDDVSTVTDDENATDEAPRRRCDTADTADSTGTAKTSPAQSDDVSTVSSVTDGNTTDEVARTVSADGVSTESGVPNSEGTDPQPPKTLLDGENYLREMRRRPPSWSCAATRPAPGCYCSCCKGGRWWTDGKGWRCWTCHPPDHLDPSAITEVKT